MTRFTEKVHKFDASIHSLGAMSMEFETQQEVLHKMDNIKQYLKVIIG